MTLSLSGKSLTYLSPTLYQRIMKTILLQLIYLSGIVLFLSHCQSATSTGSIPTQTPPLSTTIVSNITTVVATQAGYMANDIALDTTLFGGPLRVGTMDDPTLTEASGLAPSTKNPGYLWMEEDSGNPNEIQLLDKQGHIAGRFTLIGMENRDWEDIVVGPGPVAGQSYVYVCEIGDNRLRHPVKVIYRFPEPSLAGKTLPVNEAIVAIDAISLQLPDGPKNAEAVLLDPATLDLYVLSKDDRTSVYRAAYPQSLTQPTLMKRQLEILFEQVTSAGISPDGTEILIRTYGELYYYKRRAGESVVDALKRSPRRVPVAREPQGEAVGWAADGSGYYTTSEKPNATLQAIYWYPRR
jgi:hypothetical protein